MAGSRTRIRRARQPVDAAVVCAGHQELRDIVIETRTDVKHILGSLEKGSAKMEELDSRVDALETAEESRKSAAENQKETRNNINFLKDHRVSIGSLAVGLLGVLVAAWAIIFPGGKPGP